MVSALAALPVPLRGRIELSWHALAGFVDPTEALAAVAVPPEAAEAVPLDDEKSAQWQDGYRQALQDYLSRQRR